MAAYRRFVAGEITPSRHRGIGESGIDALVELLDDLRGCALGRADPAPSNRLVARHIFANGRDVRQNLLTVDAPALLVALESRKRLVDYREPFGSFTVTTDSAGNTRPIRTPNAGLARARRGPSSG
jgi:hypothetical protein